MKLINKITTAFAACLLVFMSFSCNSVSVERVEPDEEIELDGYWSSNDVKIVCDDIIGQVLNSKNVAEFEKKNGRIPVVTIGNIRNVSSEYINTEIVANILKSSILSTGKLGFMANKNVRKDLRDEVADQADHANPKQAKEFDNEDAADFMLSGSIDSMVQHGTRKAYRVYYVTIDLDDIETHRTIDSFMPSEENQPRKLISGQVR